MIENEKDKDLSEPENTQETSENNEVIPQDNDNSTDETTETINASEAIEGTTEATDINTEDKKPKRKKKLTTKAKILILCGVILAAIVAFVIVLIIYLFGGLNHTDINRDFSNLAVDSSAYNASKDKKIVNIALFGIDSRTNSNKGLSDAIMVATIDRNKGTIKLTSIARDTMVAIDDHGKTNKINAAYSYGGAELAIKTLNQSFGLDIQDYVTVNFSQLSKVIDTAGGVTVTIAEDEKNMANGIMDELTPKSAKIKKSGTVLLTGDQAVAFCRIRYIGTDTARMQRQRTVLLALLDKTKNLNAIDLANTIHTFMPLVETSLSYDKILDYSTILTNKNLQLVEMAFPNSKTDYAKKPNDTINGTWYFIYDLDVAKVQLHNFIYNDIKID